MGKMISFGKNMQDPNWWIALPTVRWSAERHPDLPVLEARGRVLLWDESDDSAEEPTIEAGTIRIAKPYLWSGMDPLIAMDDISADYAALATSILGEHAYEDDFVDWFESTFGVMLAGDPVFIEDICVKPEYRNPRQPLAALMVVEAATAFGAVDSPIIGFGFDQVSADDVARYRDQGLWDWVGPLAAEPWREVLVAARPQG